MCIIHSQNRNQKRSTFSDHFSLSGFKFNSPVSILLSVDSLRTTRFVRRFLSDFSSLFCFVILWSMATVLTPTAVDHHGQRHHGRRVKKPRDWVRWLPPEPGWLKLNTDGASKGNPGKSGGGSILRDPLGNVIFQTVRGYGVQTALVAEFLALIDGVKTYCNLGLMHSGFGLVIESDSTTLFKALSGLIAVPREILPHWHMLEYWMPFLDGMVDAIHVYREGNTEADCLANRGVMVHQEMMANQGVVASVLFCEGLHDSSRGDDWSLDKPLWVKPCTSFSAY